MSTNAPTTKHPPLPVGPAFARIAAGVDGFPEGRDAAALGSAIAAATGADLLLAGVTVELLVPPLGLDMNDLTSKTQTMLGAVRAANAPSARTATARDISIPHALTRIVEREHRDLLVVGSSRDAADGRVRIGKRTRQLLGQLACPIAVAPRGLADRRDFSIRSIGVAYDIGPESEAALAVAHALAANSGAGLHIRTVIDDRVPASWSLLANRLLPPIWDEIIQSEQSSRGQTLAELAGASTVTVDTSAPRGRPVDVLRELSDEVDLLVLGSRRWGAAARVLLGSVGEGLLQDAGCAVLAIPRPAA